MTAAAHLLHHAPAELAGMGPLPVRVRTRTGEIVGSGVTGLPIAVPPGSYYVTMLMPDGMEIGLDHEVQADVGDLPMSGALQADPPPSSPTLMPPPPLVTIEGVSFGASMWEGDWLAAWAKGAPDLSALGSDSLTLFPAAPVVIPHRDGGDRLLVLALDDRYRCTVVPFDECAMCIDDGAEARAIAARISTADEGPLIDFRSVVSDETNALLGFVESGVLTNMVAVTEDEIRKGEQAISGARLSLLRAVTGAYVLLRANALEGVERWLDQLEPWRASLPDLLPLRAELYARGGRHEEAVAVLHAWVAGDRCPWFRAGLSYMLERLRLYIDVTENRKADFNLAPEDFQEFRIARDSLERMLPAMLTSRYIATFDVPRGRA